MPNTLPAMSHASTPLAPARPGLSTDLTTPLALAPATAPAPRGWLRALLPKVVARGNRLAGIQKSMLNELRQVASTPLHDTLAREIVSTGDVEALWALRESLAEAIGDVRGDMVARQKMTEISFMFAGLLPHRAVHREAPSGENVVRLQPRAKQPGAQS